MEFKELKKDEISKVESEITEFWKREDILKQSIVLLLLITICQKEMKRSEQILHNCE